jgi:SAM-dependent methyltransferase
VPLLHGSAIGDDVEILFVDGAKSWRALVHLLRELAPRLAPGGLLVFQDHRGWGSYWVPMCVALLRERFPGRLVPVHVTTFNTTTYRLTGPLDPGILAELPRTIDDVTLAEGLRLMQAAARELRRLGDVPGARVIELAACTFCGVKGDWARAARIFKWLDARWPVEGSLVDLERARAWLHLRTGLLPAPSTHARRVMGLRQWRARLSRLVGRIPRLGRPGPALVGPIQIQPDASPGLGAVMQGTE